MATQISLGPRFHPQTAPVTFWLLVVTVVLWLVSFFGGGAVAPARGLLAFSPPWLASQPWTLLTWPLLSLNDPFSLLMLGYVFWWSGADVERWWGWRVHLGFLVAVALAVALAVTLGAALLPGRELPVVNGLGPLICAVLTVWSLRNLDSQILLLFIPISGKVLLVLEIAMTWFAFGPYFGFWVVLGSGGLAALYYFQGHRLHSLFRRGGSSRRGSGPGTPRGPSAREQRAQDKRFRRIMKKSGLSVVEGEGGKGSR